MSTYKTATYTMELTFLKAGVPNKTVYRYRGIDQALNAADAYSSGRLGKNLDIIRLELGREGVPILSLERESDGFHWHTMGDDPFMSLPCTEDSIELPANSTHTHVGDGRSFADRNNWGWDSEGCHAV